MRENSVKALVLYGMFIAVIFLLGLTPLGYIYLPMAAITTVHIPVIVGGYSLGKKGGAVLGFFFGLTSFIRCFTTPDATAAVVLGTATGFGVYNLLLVVAVLFLPRMLTGLFSAIVYQLIGGTGKRQIAAMGVSAFVGSMTNTVFYLGGLYLLAFEQTAEIMGVAGSALLTALLGIVAGNGIIEAIAAVIICTAVGKAISAYTGRNKNEVTEK
ncbi:MAG: ECF transporter S component [Clostridia bacterium]|nr:ECF transporter S component [Clostridia bacterium]